MIYYIEHSVQVNYDYKYTAYIFLDLHVIEYDSKKRRYASRFNSFIYNRYF